MSYMYEYIAVVVLFDLELRRDCTKEVKKEQPSYRNLSATARRVLQCTCPVAASRKDCSAIGKLYC
jgi:hypothetical protein